jgi:malonate-semialdehyde dehydrogenase (acetylating)/methylmalonate-semialdehyde dehydrogenase
MSLVTGDLLRFRVSAVTCGSCACDDTAGRGVVVPGYPKGNFLGPTVLEGVTADMDCYKEEVFAPVLSCMQVRVASWSVQRELAVTSVWGRAGSCASSAPLREVRDDRGWQVATVDEAINVINANAYGNGAAIFTRSGATARKFQMEVDAGQVCSGLGCCV